MRQCFRGIQFLLIIIGSISVVQAQYIDPLIYAQFDNEKEVTYIVQLKAQADLSKASLIKGKAEKARYVYDQLVKTSSSSQANIRSLANLYGCKVQSFYINNSIKITSSKVVFDEIISLEEVDQVIWDKPTPMLAVRETPCLLQGCQNLNGVSK